MTGKPIRTAFAALLCMFALQAAAADDNSRWKPNRRQQEVLASQTFLNAHPDMLNRVRAMEEMERGDLVRAGNYFRRAAYYGDKQSQAAYAEMLWEGRGVERDRAAAYAWMDLAAERGYQLFLGFRERYWAGLDEAERKRAIEIGQQIYAEYGDDVAKPRLENILRRQSRNFVGTRTGSIGAVRIIIPGVGMGTIISGNDFFDRRFWEPKRYWQWQSEIMEGVKEGRVIVGDLHTQPDEAPPPKKKDD